VVLIVAANTRSISPTHVIRITFFQQPL